MEKTEHINEQTRELNVKEWPTSNNVKETRYFKEKETLRVEFKNGSKYDYFKFPQWAWEELIKTESIGSFMNKAVKPFYDYDKVTE